MSARRMLVLCLASLLVACCCADDVVDLWDFTDESLPAAVANENATAGLAPGPNGQNVLAVEYLPPSKWPGIDLRLDEPQDWTSYTCVSVLAYNETDTPVTMGFNIHDAYWRTYAPARRLPSRQWHEFRIPVLGMMAGQDDGGWCGTAIDATHVSHVTPFIYSPTAPVRVRLARIALVRADRLPAPILTATAAADGVALSWNAIAGARGYDIFRRASGEKQVRLARFTAPRFVDISAQPDRSYTYRVAAVDAFARGGLRSRPVRAARDSSAPEALPAVGHFGGRLDIDLGATGFFRVEKIDGKWLLIDPEGHPTFSVGMCGVVLGDTFTRVTRRENLFSDVLAEKDDPKFKDAWSPWWGFEAYGLDSSGLVFSPYIREQIVRYGAENWYNEWRDRSIQRMKDWHVNTLGAWPHSPVVAVARMPYVSFSASWRGCPQIPDLNMPDVFDPAFETTVRNSAQAAANSKGEPYLIGWFTDNELPWHGDWENGKNLVSLIQLAPETLAAKQAWVKFLRERYGTAGKLNGAWETSFASLDDILAWREKVPQTHLAQADAGIFLGEFADRYFGITADALRENDPNHLVLGSRHSQAAPIPVLQANGRHTDVVSVTLYGPSPTNEALRGQMVTDKPWLAGEFHFTSADSPLTMRVGSCVGKNQAERGEMYQDYVSDALATPNMIGVHWFEYVDEPATGRFDQGKDGGEAHNIGWVDVNDEPYEDFVDRARLINANVPLAFQ